VSSRGPSHCCDGRPIWSGGGGIILAADASFLHDDPAVLHLACQVVYRRLSPRSDGNAEGL